MMLESVPNILDDSAHAKMDKEVLESGMEPFNRRSAEYLLLIIVDTSDETLDIKYRNISYARALLNEHTDLWQKLKDAWSVKSFKDIRNLKILRTDQSDDRQMGSSSGRERMVDLVVSKELSEKATVNSWYTPFQGNIVEVLSSYMALHSDPNLYARILSIVQSSGMGKSRLIDELSKTRFVIPLNLRDDESGFPASDSQVRDWFKLQDLTPEASDVRASAFITALLEKTLEVIKDPQAQIHDAISKLPAPTEKTETDALQDYPGTIPEQFRLYMTIGQKYSVQGDLRIQFYNKVIQRANDLLPLAVPKSDERKTPEGRFGSGEESVELKTIATKLLETIQPPTDDPAAVPPTIILAFDEAHTISEEISTNGARWSKFSALRRALRALRSLPVWGVFLSTTGKLPQFNPPRAKDRSDRVVAGHLHILTPFTALGFDLLARKVTFDGSCTLQDVASLEYKLSYGRPLWLSHYSKGNPTIQKNIIMFAIEKLLCRTYHPSGPLNLSVDEEFAIMSHRLALDFNTSTCSDSNRPTANTREMVQVEKHLRVCLGVKEGFESLVTVASSEPILVEAAATVMQHRLFSSCRALHRILEWPGLSKGDRGELIVANITIDTLDSLSFENGTLKSFVVKVTSYFEALFAQGRYGEEIRHAMPSKLRDADDDKTFGETFKDAYIYVTHFIKVFDYSVLSDVFIMALAVRGIGILCADNQTGVDLVLPVLYKGGDLKKTNITALMMQSKNDARFTTIPKRYLFSAMNPFTLGIFNKKEQNPRPIIRIVYALAAQNSIVCVLESKKKANHNYTSFDIWCGQTSSSTFGAIHANDDAKYQELLMQSKEVVGTFDLDSESVKEVTMSMCPGATSQPAHWKSFTNVASNIKTSEGFSGEFDSEISEWVSEKRTSGIPAGLSHYLHLTQFSGPSAPLLKPVAAPSGHSAQVSSSSLHLPTVQSSSNAAAPGPRRSTRMSDKKESKKRKLDDE